MSNVTPEFFYIHVRVSHARTLDRVKRFWKLQISLAICKAAWNTDNERGTGATMYYRKHVLRYFGLERVHLNTFLSNFIPARIKLLLKILSPTSSISTECRLTLISVQLASYRLRSS